MRKNRDIQEKESDKKGIGRKREKASKRGIGREREERESMRKRDR